MHFLGDLFVLSCNTLAHRLAHSSIARWQISWLPWKLHRASIAKHDASKYLNVCKVKIKLLVSYSIWRHTSLDNYCPKFSAHILEPLFIQCTGDNIQYLNHFYLLLLWQLCLTPKLTNNSAKAMERKKKGQCSWQTLSDWVRLGRPGKYWHWGYVRISCLFFVLSQWIH